MLTDTHCHLDDEQFTEDLDAVIERARAVDIGFILDPGVNAEASARAVEISETYDIVYAAVGYHPSDCVDFDAARHIPMIRQWAEHPKVLAIGEIGLDYYYDDGAPRDVQKRVFETQVGLAGELGLPIIVHDRDAHGDALAIVKANLNQEASGVFHCYGGSVEMARELLDMGLYLGFDGPLTFKNARKAPDVVAYAPADRLLIETDSPYMAPVPLRGRRNESSYIVHIAAKMAEYKNISVDDMIRITTENANRLFRFDTACAF